MEPQPTTETEKEATWDESRHLAALAHISRMQDQLTSMRSTLPAITSLLTRANMQRGEAYKLVVKEARRATEEVRAFREAWEGEGHQEVLVRARESRIRDADLSRQGEVREGEWREK